MQRRVILNSTRSVTAVTCLGDKVNWHCNRNTGTCWNQTRPDGFNLHFHHNPVRDRSGDNTSDKWLKKKKKHWSLMWRIECLQPFLITCESQSQRNRASSDKICCWTITPVFCLHPQHRAVSLVTHPHHKASCIRQNLPFDYSRPKQICIWGTHAHTHTQIHEFIFLMFRPCFTGHTSW